jgi:excisionase family DNA binding protein
MSTTTVGDAQPNDRNTALARDALARVKRYLARHRGEAHEPVRVRVDEPGEQPLTLPRVSVELMARILAHIAAGQTVAIVPNHAELTTQQAADLLNVSRPFLITLLDEGKIGYRRVGTHRRIVASSLLEYKRADDAARRTAADDLTAMTQELGED